MTAIDQAIWFLLTSERAICVLKALEALSYHCMAAKADTLMLDVIHMPSELAHLIVAACCTRQAGNLETLAA